MKKNLFVMIIGILIVGCNTKTPAQIAEERYKAREAKYEEEKKYADSLFFVATDDFSSKEDRLKAIDTLKTKLPGINNIWDSIATSITNK